METELNNRDDEESQVLFLEAEKLFFLSRRTEDHID
jgi:hypothetical protein